MATEIELKFRVASHDVLRDCLRAAGAAYEGRWHEQNQMFDTPGGRLRATDCGLRLRVEERLDGDARGERRASLTFKGPRQPDDQNGGTKRRSEFEAGIDDPQGLAALLAQVGLSETIVYEKRRERWRLPDIEVALDELPVLGLFVEIEGVDAGAVLGAQDRLGLPSESVIGETYVQLAAKHGTRRPDGCVELRF